MGDEGEIWNEYRKERREKKRDNEEKSLALLREIGIPYRVLNESTSHYRVGGYDYWPTTGKFYNQKTKEVGRGVKNLINKIKNEPK